MGGEIRAAMSLKGLGMGESEKSQERCSCKEPAQGHTCCPLLEEQGTALLMEEKGQTIERKTGEGGWSGRVCEGNGGCDGDRRQG